MSLALFVSSVDPAAPLHRHKQDTQPSNMGKSLDVISSDTVVQVTKGWSEITSIRNFEKICGATLFQNLFKVCPEAQVLFGFPLDMWPDPRELLGSMRFNMHAMFLMEMIDSTMSIIGKDNEKLSETLKSLGKKHATYGVEEHMFPHMQESVIFMMKKHLDDRFSAEDEAAWNLVFGALIEDIVDAQRKVALEEAAKDKAAVMETWNKFKAIKKYESVGGVILFQHLFEICPQSKPLFGFPADLDPNSEELKSSKRFMQHASFLINMIDKTVAMLGVDNEELNVTLRELGKMHVTYGVTADLFPMMTEAIIFMLKDQLGDEFQQSDNSAWRRTLSALIAAMIKGLRQMDKGLAAANKSKVIKSWRLLMQQKNYEEQAGVALFTHLFRTLPQSKVLFGFPLDMKTEDVSNSRRFLTHAVFLVEMLEKALNMLGENDEELTFMLMELGQKHVRYGVKPDYFVHMKRAIIAMLHEKLTIRFTEDDVNAWDEVLSALISDMTRAQRELEMKEAQKTFKK